MALQRLQALIWNDEQGAVHCELLQESPDGLDLHHLADTTFGPFDMATDLTAWLIRQLVSAKLFPLH